MRLVGETTFKRREGQETSLYAYSIMSETQAQTMKNFLCLITFHPFLQTLLVSPGSNF